MKKVELYIPITPIPKGRPRFSKFGHGYTPEKTRTYEAKVCKFYSENCGVLFENAVKTYMTFYMPIPKSTSKKKREQMINNEIKHTVHNGDLDNLCKGVLDALNGIAYKDDSQITVIHANKRYGEIPGIELRIVEDVE